MSSSRDPYETRSSHSNSVDDVVRRTIYIGRMNPYLTEEDLVRLFGVCGPIEVVSIAGEKADRSRNSMTFKFGFVQYKDIKSAYLAKKFDRTYLLGHIFHVSDSKGRINPATGYGSAYKSNNSTSASNTITDPRFIYIPNVRFNQLKSDISDIEHKYKIICSDITDINTYVKNSFIIENQYLHDLHEVPNVIDEQYLSEVTRIVESNCKKRMDRINNYSRSSNNYSKNTNGSFPHSRSHSRFRSRSRSIPKPRSPSRSPSIDKRYIPDSSNYRYREDRKVEEDHNYHSYSRYDNYDSHEPRRIQEESSYSSRYRRDPSPASRKDYDYRDRYYRN